MATMRARIDPTREQLAAAWQGSRRRDWPPTLDEALADPVYGALVRMAAVRAALKARQASSSTAHPITGAPPSTQPGPRPAPTATRWPNLPPAGLDRKRAASGERDDD